MSGKSTARWSKKNIKKVVIYVCSNGELELENYEKPLSNSYSMELFNSIINEDFAEELTLKQLKQLARLKTLLNSLASQSYQIVFDNSKLEKIFNKIQ